MSPASSSDRTRTPLPRIVIVPPGESLSARTASMRVAVEQHRALPLERGV